MAVDALEETEVSVKESVEPAARPSDVGRPHAKYVGTWVIKSLSSVLIALATAAATSFFLTTRPGLEYSIPPTRPVGDRAIYNVEIRPAGAEVKNLRAIVRFPNAKIEENTLDGPLGLAENPDIPGSRGVLDPARRIYSYSAPAVSPSDKLTLNFLVSSGSANPGEPEIDIRGDGVKARMAAPSLPSRRVFLLGLGAGLATGALSVLVGRFLRRGRRPGGRRGIVETQAA